MAQLWNKITANRLLVQLPSYNIIKTKAIAVSSLEFENKNFYPSFLGKMGKYDHFQRSVNLLTPMGLFQFIYSKDF